MKRSALRLITTCLTMFAIAIFVGSAFAQGNGNGGGKGGGGNGGGDDPPPPQPVQYRLTWLDNIWGANWSVRARDLNDSGIVVGYAYDGTNYDGDRAFLWTSDTGTLDLNDLENASWTDIGSSESADGWTAIRADGVNNQGEIVGTASHPDYPIRVFILVDAEFRLLPRYAGVDNRSAAINEDGVAVGMAQQQTVVFTPWVNDDRAGYVPLGLMFELDSVADINNSGAIVTRRGFRTEPTLIRADGTYDYYPGVFDEFIGRTCYGVNDYGFISGSRTRIRGKNGYDGGPTRLDFEAYVADPNSDLPNAELMLQPGSSNGTGMDINNAGHVVVYNTNGAGYVYTDIDGPLNLDTLILFDSEDDENLWTSSPITPWGINNIDETGFGQICGHLDGFPRISFFLTPVPPSGN